ncbi:MAG: aminotransferase yhxA [Ectobacillus sp.]
MRKTKQVMLGVVAAVGTSGCNGEEALPPKPDDLQCKDYEFDYDEGVWECDDIRSPHFGYYYFGGRSFSSLGVLRGDAGYQKYKQSPEFKKGFGTGAGVSGS